MTRHRLLTCLLLLTLALAGQAGSAVAGAAVAEDQPANQPPTAVEDAATTEPGTSVTIEVLANDTDDGLGRPPDTPARLEVVAAAGGTGTLSFSPTTVTYRPGDEETGDVTLTYQVSDGELQSTGAVVVHVEHVPSTAPASTISIHLTKRLVGLRRYSVHGRVRPNAPRPLRVLVQTRKPAGGWEDLGSSKVDEKGRYAVRYRPDRARKVTLRAIADWSASPRTFSERISRRVLARPDVRVSGPLTRRQVRYSWRAGCPVPPSSLRRITINRFDYRRTLRRGSLVVHAAQVPDMVSVLRAALEQRFPIRHMRPTDYYYDHGRRTPSQSDLAAMADDNTSAFNCRPVTGNPYRISQHSYGNAIDINTVRNPYVTGSRVYPSWARKYLDRSRYRAGMILSGGVVASRMRSLGWLWGARWGSPDYQHFSSNGG